MGNKIGVSLFDLGKQHCYWSQSRVYLTYFSKCESSLRLEREKKKKERERQRVREQERERERENERERERERQREREQERERQRESKLHFMCGAHGGGRTDRQKGVADSC